MGVTWELEDREATRMRRTARTLWGFGIAASVFGMVAGLTFCRPPAPPASVELIHAQMTTPLDGNVGCVDIPGWTFVDFRAFEGEPEVCIYER